MRGKASLSLSLLLALLPAGAGALEAAPAVGAVVPAASLRVAPIQGAGVTAAAPQLPSLDAGLVPAGIPALPAAADGLAAPVAGASANADASAVDQARSIAGGAAEAQGHAGEPDALLNSRFDGSAVLPDAAPPGEPRRPEGIRAVEVHVVRAREDVLRLIPEGGNSSGLRAKLAREVGRMAPYRVFEYVDARRGSFTAIDLSQKPRLVENFPEQESHEIALIKKLQLYTRDLQIVVREQGKTPDLVMNGVMTELKSLIGTRVDEEYLVNKANNQVREHAHRHGLGHGAVALDLTELAKVPETAVAKKINAWSRRTKPQENFLDTIYVLAGPDLRVFTRKNDRYFVEPYSRTPLAPKAAPARVDGLAAARPRDAGEIRTLRALAERRLALEARGAQAERLAARLTRLARRGSPHEAWKALKAFQSERPRAGDRLEPFVRELLRAFRPS